MKLNCKPGCLTIRVRKYEDSFIEIGSIVKVIGDAQIGLTMGKLGRIYSTNGEVLWFVEYKGELTDPETGSRWAVPDSHLRPIRDSDGADETLAWAGKPEPIVTDKEIA